MTLGEKLRQAREERGISISEVAEQTRISSLYLESIEADNYKPLPGGIFNKGFVKSYAKFIGLDEHEALHDYAKIVAETEGRENDPLRKYQPEVLTDERITPSMTPTVIFAAIILALGTAGILFLLNFLQGRPEDPITANRNASGDLNQETTQTSEQPVPKPSFDTIRLEFKALGEPVSLSTVIDGKPVSETITSDKPKIIEGKESVRVSYYRGFQDKVELTLNGRKLEPPEAPIKGIAIAFEINRNNLEQIWQRGRIGEVPIETAPTHTPAASPTVTATATPTLPAPTPTISPAASPTTPPATDPTVIPLPTPARTPTPRTPTRTPTPRPVTTPTPAPTP